MDELFVTRNGWFYPHYELTDGQFIYGRISYQGGLRRYTVVDTLVGSWKIKRKGWFSRTLLINAMDDKTIGTLVPEIWVRDFTLEMNSGFKGIYRYTSLFSRQFVLTVDGYGDIMLITQKLFSIKKPFNVTASTNLPKNMPPLALLILIATSLILIRTNQHQAAT